jgi:osmotically-inducible protein OsmY
MARTLILTLLSVFTLLVAGCATKNDQADAKPAMRALGQAAQPEETTSDEAVGVEVRRRLGLADAAATASDIVEVSEGAVTLRGTAASLQDAWRAEAAARGVPGVKDVRNEILVNQ